MTGWIRRLLALFKRPTRDAATRSHPGGVEPDEPHAVPAAPTEWGAHIDVDSLYFQLLLGVEAGEPVSDSAEASLLNALERLSRSNLNTADLVPRMPSVIPHLLKSLRDQNVSGAQLAQEIERDVVLVAEVLRQANSSYYHPAEPIASLENAVMVLGLNGLRILIAKVAFHPLINIQTGRLSKMAAPHVWEHSEKCVHACRRLAPEHAVDPFEAFLAGMLQNVGLIVALRVIDATLRGHPVPASRSVLDAVAYYARILSARIGREWDFPPQVVVAVEEQDSASHERERSSLGKLLYRADQLGKLWILAANGKVSEQDVSEAFWLTESDLECFRELSAFAS